jgi:uncharacterized protein YchJ
MAIIKCYCGSLSNYSQCCEGYIKGVKKPTAEKLMRSRYSAYVRQEAIIWLQQHILLKGNSILKRISWHGHAATIGKVGSFK